MYHGVGSKASVIRIGSDFQRYSQKLDQMEQEYSSEKAARDTRNRFAQVEEETKKLQLSKCCFKTKRNGESDLKREHFKRDKKSKNYEKTRSNANRDKTTGRSDRGVDKKKRGFGNDNY